MKKIISIALVCVLLLAFAVSCEKKYGTESPDSTPTALSPEKTPDNTPSAVPEATTGAINVISREEGSGTRGAFIELFGVEQKDADGKKIDYTTDAAEITSSTAVMMTTVAGDKSAIGYISLGSLNDTIKALKIDGALPSAATVKDGSYAISRPFNIATKDGLSDAAQDFISYILSEEGQTIVEGSGYIRLDTLKTYESNGSAGKVVIVGSSSVSPLMEKLKEAYEALNTGASIEIQTNDSTTGVMSVIEGICDIGMASRALKDSEIEKGVSETTIATDGIAVIVNNASAISALTKDQVKSIYVGEVTDWAELS
ncbi:MAG: extracellular solute-binding protein [Oscillospiraceae bacterium]|jgi:phosphate transport system substrate-binding protein|nr:extracellular solute-binding protein [Oscillospiraceae bacterium]